MDKKTHLAFHCLKPCGTRFEAEPTKTDESGIYAPCPTCSNLAKQAAWQVNLMRTIGKKTGPISGEGKAKSAANLEGYPTPEQTQLIRFNALQSGAFAQTATVFPAKPGRYPECDVCEHLDEDNADDSYCKKHKACLKKTEVFLLNHLAQETQNPEVLRPLMANFQSGIMSIAQSMMLEITQKGVLHESPEMWFDKDSSTFIPQQFTDESGQTKTIMKTTANPLLKVFMEFMHKNGMTLNDLAMTPKVQEEHQIMGGFTKGEVVPEDIDAVRAKQKKQLEDFKALSQRAHEARSNDPTLIAVQEETGGNE